MKFHGAIAIAIVAAAMAAPVAAVADPPAVTAPLLPAPFIGAPMNDDPNNGQFTVNFDDQGRYLGTGTAPEHLANFNLSPATAPGRVQARTLRLQSAGERSAVNSVFANFQERLRVVSGPQPQAQLVGVGRR